MRPQGEDHELERLKSECCVCEKCGHVQAEPNWCHKCGHRTSMPDWAKPLVDAFHERNELREREDLPPDDGSGYVTGTAYSRMVEHYESRLSSPERNTEGYKFRSRPA